MGGYQTPSYPGQEAHKLSSPQGSALGLLHLLRQKGPRTGCRGSVNTPDFPPQRAQVSKCTPLHSGELGQPGPRQGFLSSVRATDACHAP